MPRLLPADWIKIIAINRLLQLYEQDTNFMQEWEGVKEPYISLIEQFGKISIIMEVEYLLRHSPPSELIGWISDLQKLRNYLRVPHPGMEHLHNPLEMQASYDDLLQKLTPYVSSLNELANEWNLRAPRAGEELMWRDMERVWQEIFNVAQITTLDKFSDKQIQKLLDNKTPTRVEPLYPSALSLYLASGRVGYLNKLNARLKEFEKDLKASGAKEPPSALGKHAEWWFEHYVHGKSYTDIASKVANSAGNPEAVYIGKAVVKFSGLIDVQPIERN